MWDDKVGKEAEALIKQAVDMLENENFNVESFLERGTGLRLFVVPKDEQKEANKFISQQKAKELKRQIKRGQLDKDAKIPYHGAIGGAVEYSFCETSIGTIIKVKYLDKEKDVTNYSCW